MNLEEFNARRAARAAVPTPRTTCPRCRKAVATCYCHLVKPFESPVAFVILQHSDEARNAIATARMAHLSLTNSQLFTDRSFAGHRAVDALIADTSVRNFILYPSLDATPLDSLLAPAGAGIETDDRPVVLWVLDAKWSQVPKMLRLSPNVRSLPKTAFTPERPSRFQIRKQPRPSYLSTIECMHYVIDRQQQLRGGVGSAHHALIEVFQHLVTQQLSFVDVENDKRHRVAQARRAARKSGVHARP